MVAAAMTAYAGELVVGVAGHIDHGKTALVRALTGTDTDRLPEEKAPGHHHRAGLRRAHPSATGDAPRSSTCPDTNASSAR
jgi:translation initiation factor 2 gamma subunit (eIF-2gamma)